MSELGLLYVSESRLLTNSAQFDVEKLVEGARSRNLRLNITGALLYTGRFFAQRIEGPAEVVEMLIRDIKQNSRHHQVRVAQIEPLIHRRFARWSMAYSGPSIFVEHHVEQIFQNVDAINIDTYAKRIVDIMFEFQN